MRVSASNIKRFGPAAYSVPSGAIPCSECISVSTSMSPSPPVPLQCIGWHDVEGTEPRYAGSTGTIQTIAMQLRQVINESAGKYYRCNVLYNIRATYFPPIVLYSCHSRKGW